MTVIRQPNVLAGAYIDRAAHHRKDAEWLARAADDSRSLFLPVWQTKNLIVSERAGPKGGLRALFIERNHAVFAELHAQSKAQIFLGLYRDRACFAWAIDATHVPAAIALQQFQNQWQDQSFDAAQIEFQDIRMSLGAFERDEAGLLAYARAIVAWRERHLFCSACGSRTEARQAGHAVKCTNEACGIEVFPRIDPAIIVLITDGERCLLGRQAVWRPGWYSTIAGFCEVGESLEDAVAREVLEETGVTVDRVEYHSSQPWPFPQSLMLGFIAHARTTEIALSDQELEDAQWFTREQIASGMPMTPPPISISGCLIEEWYDRDAPRPLREEPSARTWLGRSR